MVLSQAAKVSRLFPIQRKGFMSMGASCQPTRRSVHSHLFYSLVVDFAFQDMPPGHPGGSRLIVGDAANGDSILAWFFGTDAGLCANGDLRHVDPWTIIGGTGRYAGARGSFTTDQCSNVDTGETSGTISGTIVVRGR